MTARFSMRSWPGGGGRLESERVPLPGSWVGAPDPPCSLSNHFPSQPPPSTHGLPCFFSGICSYFENAFSLAILTLLYTTNIIFFWVLTIFSCPISSFPYLHYLYFTPILVDTQLMCTFHLLCSMTKLKEHSRAICCSNFCYLHYPACHRLPSHQRCLTSPRWPHVHHIFLPESTPLFKTKKSPSEWESEGMRPPKTDAILNIYSIYVYCAKGAHTHQSLCGKLHFNLGRSVAKGVMCNHTCGAKVIFSSLIQKNTTVTDLGFIRLINLR